MDPDQLRSVFDRQAEQYDRNWEAIAPIRDALLLLAGSAFADLPDNARFLGVGVGTGMELAHLARRFPGGRFTAVEPSTPMLDLCRQRADESGFAERCTFHEGYLETLADTEPFDAATCLLVSQFLLDRNTRSSFFTATANRLRPGGILITADLAAGPESDDFESLLRIWLTTANDGEVTDEQLDRARATYARDVAILSPPTVAEIIQTGGFTPPVQIFQAGLLHAWCARRLPEVLIPDAK